MRLRARYFLVVYAPHGIHLTGTKAAQNSNRFSRAAVNKKQA
jgi:hypothetical protein